MPCAAHVIGVQVALLSHMPRTHVSPAGQGPQSRAAPQPSPAAPHWRFWAAHVVGVQIGLYGSTQAPRSKRMNSRTFSCAVIVRLPHSAGKTSPCVPAIPSSATLLGVTWKSLYRPRPHCAVLAAPIGVLNEKNSGANFAALPSS